MSEILALSREAIFLLVFSSIIFGGVIFFVARRLRYLDIREARTDATTRSRAVILGEVYEKIAPLIEGFPYQPKDMVFVGKGIDYVIFDGLSEGKLREIVFLELKTGKSALNKNEREIEATVRAKRVRYECLRIDKMTQ